MNRFVLTLFVISTLLFGGALSGLAATSNISGLPPAATKHWTADNGNGTYSNRLFSLNTSGQPGGYADFDNYTVEEPRARGLERMIPLGKTLTLSSGADGSFLSADPQQWVNLMRGDSMFMSLVNHRDLATRPNEPGPVTVSAAGPRPARKSGECFKWKEVE